MKTLTGSFLLLACALVLAADPSRAQGRRDPLPPGLEDLPIGLSPREQGQLDQIGIFRSTTAPPLGPVRASAEWDENIGVFCLWDNASLMAELQQQNDVYVITQNSSWWLSWLASNGIPSTRFRFVNAPTNTWWVRDYGPWFIWDGNQDFGLVDSIYNRPRPLDDVVPGAIATAYGIPYYGVDLIHTGGNYYADGYGNLWSSRLVYQENPTKTQAQVDQLVLDYLGVGRYVTAELNYDIQHFDTFGKLLAPDTLLWGSFPQDTTPWAWSEAALKQYRKLQSPYGWPYKIHRMPLWSQSGSWTAYINSLMTMRKIVMSAYSTGNDALAQAIYQAAAPGYQVRPVNAAGTVWGDSVHCRTRNFIRGDALRIYPRPHWEATDDELNPYVVTAEIIPPKPAAVVGAPTIWWTVTGGAPFTSAPMFPTGNPREYGGAIPAFPHGTNIAYYIEAQDSAGNVKTAPLVAPDGLFTIRVEEDSTPPDLQHTAIHSLRPSAWPPEITCTAVDATGIPAVTLEYRVNRVARPSLPMVRDAGTFVFRARMAGNVALGDVVSYRVVASDQAVPANTIASPTSGWNWFRIGDANSILVIELDRTPDSGSALVDWCNDFALDVQYTNTWPSSLSGYDAVMVCLGMNPTQADLTSAQANALVSYLNAGGAAYMEGGDCWAQSATSSIYRAYFGAQSATSGATLSSPIVGALGEVTEGMSFGYAGERNSSDHLTPAAGAHAILSAAAQTKAVSYSTGTFRTVAAAFQIGGLQGGAAPSRAKYLAGMLLDQLGLRVDLVTCPDPANPGRITVDVEGEPGKLCTLFCAPSPGYSPLGAVGVFLIDRTRARVAHSQVVPASGRLRFEVQGPSGPAFYGTERYFQAYMSDSSPAGHHLTNRDRVPVDYP